MSRHAICLILSLLALFLLTSGEVLRCLNGQEVYVDAAVGSSRTIDVLVRNLSPSSATVTLAISGDGFSLVSAASADIPARVSCSAYNFSFLSLALILFFLARQLRLSR